MGKKKKKEEYPEKRAYQRFLMQCEGYIKDGEEVVEIKVMNVSGQGLGFRTNKFLKVKNKYSVHLEVKGLQKPFVVTGEVTWVKVIDRSLYAVGFKLDMTSWIKMSEILS